MTIVLKIILFQCVVVCLVHLVEYLSLRSTPVHILQTVSVFMK